MPTLDIFSSKQYRNARPQISTSPVRRVPVRQDIPGDVAEERAAQLRPTATPIQPRSLFSAPPSTAPARPNAGGTMTRNGVTTRVPPSAGGPPQRSATMNAGGTMTRGGVPTNVAPSPYQPPTAASAGGTMQRAGQPALAVPPTPVASPTTVAAPQTEANNPLTGANNQQAGGTTAPIPDPAKALGFSQRGGVAPAGQDVAGATGAGGSGLFAGTFKNPRAAGIYEGVVKKLFGG